MSPKVYGIEGLDRLGKSTLIDGIQNLCGHFQVIHFAKPQKLKVYEQAAMVDGVPNQSQAAWHYQKESFRNSMLLACSGARIIFDRWHIGEAVYSPMYRGYDGDYVFKQEILHGLDQRYDIRLILLTENFEKSRHFIDDGHSLGPARNRQEEQLRFLEAFSHSRIKDKRIICVTDENTGNFKHKNLILDEVLS